MPSWNFASDNTSGVHPAIMDALNRANEGAAPPYGDDPWTARAAAAFVRLFGKDTEVFLVPQGTGSNVLGLRAMTAPWQSILVSDSAHTLTSESGAVEAVLGARLTPLPSTHAKIDPAAVHRACSDLHLPHEPVPGVLALTQSTEVSTVYRADELRAICDAAHSHGLLVHMDGARFANAVASQNCDPRALANEAGVDMLSFGGTKNGLMYGEAILIFNPVLSRHFAVLRKQCLQLMSKQRFLGAQFEAYLHNDLWLKLASHANRMALRLAASLADCPHAPVAHPVDGNGVFVTLAPDLCERLQQHFAFGVNHATQAARFMCSFNTTEQEVTELATAIRNLKTA